MADTKFCPHCGQKTENDVNFCPNCGNRLPSKPAREEPQSNIKALNYTPGFSNRINGPEVMAATEKTKKKRKILGLSVAAADYGIHRLRALDKGNGVRTGIPYRCRNFCC